MDLGAYAQITNLNDLLEFNNIDIPRLRGLRLMANEEPVTKEFIQGEINWMSLDRAENMCCSKFIPNAAWAEYSSKTRKLRKQYLIYEKGKTFPIGINWEKWHGKKRKDLKRLLKGVKKKVIKQYSLFNKYCGRPDVLYIHARIGAGNWGWYNCDEIIKNQPWFLDVVEDSFDCTYVDIYAKINIPESETGK